MVTNSFFDEQKEQSLIKATIVAKYFDVWANVIVNTQKRNPHQPQKIAYIDLFAGRGRYDLQDSLLEAYAGQTLSMRTIYEEHSVDTPYIASNYKEALKNLENDGKITARKSDGSKRRKGTFADDVLATFPDRKE